MVNSDLKRETLLSRSSFDRFDEVEFHDISSDGEDQDAYQYRSQMLAIVLGGSDPRNPPVHSGKI